MKKLLSIFFLLSVLPFYAWGMVSKNKLKQKNLTNPPLTLAQIVKIQNQPKKQPKRRKEKQITVKSSKVKSSKNDTSTTQNTSINVSNNSTETISNSQNVHCVTKEAQAAPIQQQNLNLLPQKNPSSSHFSNMDRDAFNDHLEDKIEALQTYILDLTASRASYNDLINKQNEDKFVIDGYINRINKEIGLAQQRVKYIDDFINKYPQYSTSKKIEKYRALKNNLTQLDLINQTQSIHISPQDDLPKNILDNTALTSAYQQAQEKKLLFLDAEEKVEIPFAIFVTLTHLLNKEHQTLQNIIKKLNITIDNVNYETKLKLIGFYLKINNLEKYKQFSISLTQIFHPDKLTNMSCPAFIDFLTGYNNQKDFLEDNDGLILEMLQKNPLLEKAFYHLILNKNLDDIFILINNNRKDANYLSIFVGALTYNPSLFAKIIEKKPDVDIQSFITIQSYCKKYKDETLQFLDHYIEQQILSENDIQVGVDKVKQKLQCYYEFCSTKNKKQKTFVSFQEWENSLLKLQKNYVSIVGQNVLDYTTITTALNNILLLEKKFDNKNSLFFKALLDSIKKQNEEAKNLYNEKLNEIAKNNKRLEKIGNVFHQEENIIDLYTYNKETAYKRYEYICCLLNKETFGESIWNNQHDEYNYTLSNDYSADVKEKWNNFTQHITTLAFAQSIDKEKLKSTLKTIAGKFQNMNNDAISTYLDNATKSLFLYTATYLPLQYIDKQPYINIDELLNSQNIENFKKISALRYESTKKYVTTLQQNLEEKQKPENIYIENQKTIANHNNSARYFLQYQKYALHNKWRITNQPLSFEEWYNARENIASESGEIDVLIKEKWFSLSPFTLFLPKTKTPAADLVTVLKESQLPLNYIKSLSEKKGDKQTFIYQDYVHTAKILHKKPLLFNEWLNKINNYSMHRLPKSTKDTATSKLSCIVSLITAELLPINYDLILYKISCNLDNAQVLDSVNSKLQTFIATHIYYKNNFTQFPIKDFGTYSKSYDHCYKQIIDKLPKDGGAQGADTTLAKKITAAYLEQSLLKISSDLPENISHPESYLQTLQQKSADYIYKQQIKNPLYWIHYLNKKDFSSQAKKFLIVDSTINPMVQAAVARVTYKAGMNILSYLGEKVNYDPYAQFKKQTDQLQTNLLYTAAKRSNSITLAKDYLKRTQFQGHL